MNKVIARHTQTGDEYIAFHKSPAGMYEVLTVDGAQKLVMPDNLELLREAEEPTKQPKTNKKKPSHKPVTELMFDVILQLRSKRTGNILYDFHASVPFELLKPTYEYAFAEGERIGKRESFIEALQLGDLDELARATSAP